MDTKPITTAADRHAQVYTTPGLPPFEYFPIGRQGQLWHGRNPLTAFDIETLADSCGITHILDLREPREWNAPGRFGGEALDEIAVRSIVRLNVPVADTTPPTDDDFTDAVEFLNAAWLLPNSHIYVHCRYGRERTGTVLMAWRALHDGIDCENALATLNAEGAHLSPLPYQRLEAQRWVSSRRR